MGHICYAKWNLLLNFLNSQNINWFFTVTLVTLETLWATLRQVINLSFALTLQKLFILISFLKVHQDNLILFMCMWLTYLLVLGIFNPSVLVDNHKSMNSSLTRGEIIKLNKFSKMTLTLTSITLFLYGLG